MVFMIFNSNITKWGNVDIKSDAKYQISKILCDGNSNGFIFLLIYSIKIFQQEINRLQQKKVDGIFKCFTLSIIFD